MRPYATVPARSAQPQLVPPVELERIRARSGRLTDPHVVMALLDHIDIQGRVIHGIAMRVEGDGTDEERARVRAALELTDEHAPIHVRIEFELASTTGGGFATLIEAIREWTLEEVATLVDAAHVTATHRGASASWDTRLP